MHTRLTQVVKEKFNKVLGFGGKREADTVFYGTLLMNLIPEDFADTLVVPRCSTNSENVEVQVDAEYIFYKKIFLTKF